MKASSSLWKTRLDGELPPQLAAEIDIYETELARKKQGRMDDRIFAETRLRRGVYGQRYDNGRRHDGVAVRHLEYPSGELTKGPGTLWDAPGMQRIKVPFGGLDARQLEVIAELAEEYSVGVAHVTTRQDFQLHYVHIEDTPALMRRLAAVGMTTREACGNTVRNVTACPLAGVCPDQVFDVTPYAKALACFLLGHPDCQDFGRKFKIAFSGCKANPCALVSLHDMGAIAVTCGQDGAVRRGFELYVGGGLGAVPQQARLFMDFLPEEELLPMAQAIARVYARLGEKKNRNTARLKFLVSKLGIEEFKRLVVQERASLACDPAWTAFLGQAHSPEEAPLKHPALLQIAPAGPESFHRWRTTNVYWQRQPGYAAVTIVLPLGDITAHQLRQLAAIARRQVNDTIRTTAEQNMVLRWVREPDLPALYSELEQAGLAEPYAGSIVDITACPGTDTCKLGIASSRGLAEELRTRLGEKSGQMDEAVRGLRIKISGCFNSCGQHHVADLGFYGVSRHKNGYTVPHFQVLLGGNRRDNAASYGLAIGAIPSRRIPGFVERITARYVAERLPAESFLDFVQRIGKAECRRMLDEFAEVPAHQLDTALYTDWGDAREFTVGDLGVGECAGEVVSSFDFRLTACEREVFQAQLRLEQGQMEDASSLAYRSMLGGAQALLALDSSAAPSDPDTIVSQFRARFHDTRLFFDPYTQGKFAQYFFKAHERNGGPCDAGSARQLIEEAQLFLEAVHSCRARMARASAAAGG